MTVLDNDFLPGEYPVYEGNDLGCICKENETCFRVWAPTADYTELRLYREGYGRSPYKKIPMERAECGTWVCSIDRNLSGVYYTYCVHTRFGWLKETIDPYAKACGTNGIRGMVINPGETDPEGFAEDRGPAVENTVDLVIAETSVRDATADASAGSLHAGLYLGLAEKETKTDTGIKTGLGHLKELGVTHVQLMPFYDFASIDEARHRRTDYNWGYDPQNYNIPEGSFSTDSVHGEVRIRECKEMIRAIHSMGIGVIMDVVYNHVYDIQRSSFQCTVPDYFFRRYYDEKKDKMEYSNGSGCGNEVASERPMVRKYLIDSLCYWVREYHIDGFRFDLMGLFDLETMQQAREALRKIKPDIILYGEGWAGGMTAYPEQLRAVKKNISLLKGFSVFSDDIRDHIKGNVFSWEDRGYVSGRMRKENDIRFSVAAGIPHPQVDTDKTEETMKKYWAKEPGQVINYVSCHDNLTLWDKLSVSCPDETEEERLKINRLCAAIVFTSQGIPFFLEGEEFARSKPVDSTGKVSGNSYNLSLQTNSLKYGQLEKYGNLYEYYRGLIAFRKAHKALRLRTADEIAGKLQFFEKMPANVVGFRVTKEEDDLIVVYNPNTEAVILSVTAEGEWSVCINGAKAGTESLSQVSAEENQLTFTIEERTAQILVHNKKTPA